MSAVEGKDAEMLLGKHYRCAVSVFCCGSMLAAPWTASACLPGEDAYQEDAYHVSSLHASVASEDNYASLLDALLALQYHVLGKSDPLDASDIAAYKVTIDAHRGLFGDRADLIEAALDLVRIYDQEIGPLWVARGGFNRNTQPDDLDWTIYHVMQYIMDYAYTHATLEAHADLLAGFYFGSVAHFPGFVEPPEDPDVSYSVLINGSFPETFGRDTQAWRAPARKATGAYVAPGSIVTVTVPEDVVGRGYRIRVGAHSWDLSTRRPQVRRLDRATILYDLDEATIQVASPYGGGIYVEVPIGSDAGIFEVTMQGAVRAPFFSAQHFNATTLADWLAHERHHPAPWADFQSDKFMMQVPRSWIYDHPDPVQLMEDWDTAIDIQNDLMGFPRDRGKETMYCQVDVIMRASVHAPGYPAVNAVDQNPMEDRGGYRNHYLVRGPGMNYHAANIEIHEQGHAYFFPKLGGEREAAVNLPHVAVMQQGFGYDWDESFRGSLGITNPHRTLDNTAVTWMTSFSFSPINRRMHEAEKAYQLKGHAKFVDVARLYGWDVLGDYWRSFMEDQAAGKPIDWSDDGHMLRLSKAVGRDIRPLFHFWGIHPSHPAALERAITDAGIPRGMEIYERLLHYQSLVPENNAAFRSFAQGWWNKPEPNINGFWTETEHARQWDERIRRDRDGHIRTDITVGEKYNEAAAQQVREQVQEIMDIYYPRPPEEPLAFSAIPATTNGVSIAMRADDVDSIFGEISYYFACVAGEGRDSGWQSSPHYVDANLEPGQLYTYRVRARDDAGNYTGWSSPMSAIPYDAARVGMLPFSETFDALLDGFLDGQRGWRADGVMIENPLPASDNQFAAMEAHGGKLHRVFEDNQDRVWTDLWMWPHAIDTRDDIPAIPDGSTIVVYVGKHFEIMVFDGREELATGLMVPEGSWVRFTMHSDYAAGTWDLYVNGDYVGRYDFYEKSVSGYEQLEIRGGGETRINNVHVKRTPPSRAFLSEVPGALRAYALDAENPVLRMDDGTMQYRHVRLVEEDWLAYRLQVRTNLLAGSWVDVEIEGSIQSDRADVSYETITYDLPLDGNAVFYRLLLEKR